MKKVPSHLSVTGSWPGYCEGSAHNGQPAYHLEPPPPQGRRLLSADGDAYFEPGSSGVTLPDVAAATEAWRNGGLWPDSFADGSPTLDCVAPHPDGWCPDAVTASWLAGEARGA